MRDVYQDILLLVQQVPRGQVATYGQIAWIAGAATPRMVGYALAGLPEDADIPWQRIINSRGGLSPRGDPLAVEVQRRRLEEEGVRFGPEGRVDLARYGWPGPDPGWLEERGFVLAPWPGPRRT